MPQKPGAADRTDPIRMVKLVVFSPMPPEGSRPTSRTGSRTAHGATTAPSMSLRNNRDKKAALALAIAGGGAVRAWADANGVPPRTAYSWSRSPEVRALVGRIRRRAIDRAIGRLSKHANAAAETIRKLADSATSEAVRLQAARAVLADLITVTNYAALEARLDAVERRIADHAQHQQHQPADHGASDRAG